MHQDEADATEDESAFEFFSTVFNQPQTIGKSLRARPQFFPYGTCVQETLLPPVVIQILQNARLFGGIIVENLLLFTSDYQIS